MSLLFDGGALTEHHELAPGRACLGRPVWGRRAFLENLELRLGLPRSEPDGAVRLQHWSSGLREVAKQAGCFYASSWSVDPIGTAKALLEWRDELVLEGWEGTRIHGGGARLDTLAEVEKRGGVGGLAPGFSDRVKRVRAELRDASVRPFDAVELAEPAALWPALWRSVFELLERHGTPMRVSSHSFVAREAVSDLGVVQGLLAGQEVSALPALRGDGSVLLLEGETSWELGRACAALLGSWDHSSAVVLRAGDVSALHAGFVAQGLPSQGWPAWSEWRPALQALPLALELVFEPRDPYRVLELLTLPAGPFDGRIGRELARALSEAPGIGGRPWQRAKERLLAASVDPVELADAVEWLETPGHSMAGGAPQAALLDVVARVQRWLDKRLGGAHAALAASPADARCARVVSALGAAFGQVRGFRQALEPMLGEPVPLVVVRQLVEEVSRASMLRLSAETSGRVDHVDHAAAVRCPRDVVLWWHCVAEEQWRPAPSRWRRAEREALVAAGLGGVGGAARLAAESGAWQALVLAARERLVLAIPRTAGGQSLSPHPIVDWIAGSLGERAAELTRLRVDVRDWLAFRSTAAAPLRLAASGLASVEPLPLPEARAEWRVPASLLAGEVQHSARSLEWLVGCPLKWVFRYRAGLSSGFMEAIASGPKLNGQLGHRLIEELQLSGVLHDSAALRNAAEAAFDRLVHNEGAVLLRPGQASELAQLKAQLCQSIEHFAALLSAAELKIAGVEVATSVSWRGRVLEGRLDLLLADAEGRERIVDLKWGLGRHEKLLTNGNALQLASYAACRQLASPASAFPHAGYYSLSRGKLLTTEPGAFARSDAVSGPTLAETWQRLEHTVELVESAFTAGRIPVTGLKLSLPLVDERAPASETVRSLALERGAACEYCDYPALCGRSWEDYA